VWAIPLGLTLASPGPRRSGRGVTWQASGNLAINIHKFFLTSSSQTDSLDKRLRLLRVVLTVITSFAQQRWPASAACRVFVKGGLLGAVTGAVAGGLVLPELIATPTGKMAVARSLASPKTHNGLIPLLKGSSLQANRQLRRQRPLDL